MIKVQTSEDSLELDDEERFLFQAILREIRQASYIFEEDATWTGFLELLSAVRAERKSTDLRVENSTDQMEWLSALKYRTCEHLGAAE